MTHQQALTALADAVEQLDRRRMESPLHISSTDGDGFMLMTRELYANMVKRIYDLQRRAEDGLPSDEELLEELQKENRKGMH